MVFLVIFVALTGAFAFYVGGFFERGQADLSTFFIYHPWLYLMLVPAIGMRLWAEERKTGTIELLMTQPISPWEAILGKFLAAWAFIGLALILTFPMWFTVNVLGQPDNGVILASYLGSFLMAGAYLAVASCISALTKNQVIAFVVAATVCFLLVMSGLELVQNFFRAWAPAQLLSAIASLSFLSHFESITKGLVDLPAIVFYALADRVRPVRQQDHHRSAQGRLKVRVPWLKPRKKPQALSIGAAAAAGRINRHHLAWGGLALGAIILLAVNLIASSALRDARLDLTKERLYTISEGTRKALRSIDEPIDVRVYFSKKLGEAAPSYAKMFERVRTLLEQYRGIARGKLQITFLDPEPFSDAEDRAVAAGLKGIRLNQEGEMGYFGIVGTNSTDTEVEPALPVDRSRALPRVRRDQADRHAGEPDQERHRPHHRHPDRGQPRHAHDGPAAVAAGILMLDHIREFFEVKTHRQGRQGNPLRHRRADGRAARGLVAPTRPTPSTSSRCPAARCWPSSIPWRRWAARAATP